MESASGLDATEDGLYVVHIYLIIALFGEEGPSQTHLQPHPTKVEDGLPSALRTGRSYPTLRQQVHILSSWVGLLSHLLEQMR